MKTQLNLDGFGDDLEAALNKELRNANACDVADVTRALQRATKKVFGEAMKSPDAKKLAREIVDGLRRDGQCS
ncbi:hypothetical protein [Gordonia liuliyuniae]|uniref:Uncharacterized protein n=1 Tax=Gordonia liuliyuniae TaxID=2911517 RepID=A0ABS9IS67_9ACTN|nr:hypothetical protein [Gordonia liuliyuniae]MCF8588393.1 hypothetical protein [Gordonia liuliyuniae]